MIPRPSSGFEPNSSLSDGIALTLPKTLNKAKGILKTHAHVNLIDYLEAHNIRTPEYVGPYKGLLLSSGSHFRKYTLQQCKFAQGSCQSRMAQSSYEGSASSSHKERSLSCVFRGEHLCLKRYRARHPYPRLGK